MTIGGCHFVEGIVTGDFLLFITSKHIVLETSLFIKLKYSTCNSRVIDYSVNKLWSANLQ